MKAKQEVLDTKDPELIKFVDDLEKCMKDLESQPHLRKILQTGIISICEEAVEKEEGKKEGFYCCARKPTLWKTHALDNHPTTYYYKCGVCDDEWAETRYPSAHIEEK